MKPLLGISLLFILISCGVKRQGNTEEKESGIPSSSDSLPSLKADLEKKEFYCIVNGKEFTYDENYCIRKPQFNYYAFDFYGSTAFHLGIDLINEKKTVPFTIDILNDTKVNYPASLSYEIPPEIYSTPVDKNQITVTEWDKNKQTISLNWKGTVTDLDKTKTFELEGYFNKMPYVVNK